MGSAGGKRKAWQVEEGSVCGCDCVTVRRFDTVAWPVNHDEVAIAAAIGSHGA
jgi:hypothetical protein